MARLPCRALHALLPIALLSGCATLTGSRRHSLAVAANVDSAVVRDARGNVLGVTPLAGPLRLRPGRDTLVIDRPDRDAVRVPLGRRVDPTTRVSLVFGAGIGAFGLLSDKPPVASAGLALAVIGWLVDRAGGRGWLHEHDSVYATLPPPRPPPLAAVASAPPPPPSPPTFADPALIAETLRLVAAAADEAGCDSTFARFWLGERDELGARREISAAEREAIARNVEAAAPRLRDACARASPLARTDRRAIENPLPPLAADVSAAVYFATGSSVVPDSVRPRLGELARRLRASGDGLTLVVEGFADPAGGDAYNQALGLARARAVVAVLRAAGPLPADCCVALSRGEDPASLAAPGHAGAAPAARYNRRVTFHLEPAEAQR